MDLRSGYWQINRQADRERRHLLPQGLYEFKVMPFGLCNAPATFERMMDNLLRHFKWTMCLCYLDDIIVFSETFEDHLIRLRLVLKCLQEAGLKLNSKKCLLLPKKRFIKGFCYLAEPLQSLLKSGVEFHWGPEEVEAFNSLKKALTSDQYWGLEEETETSDKFLAVTTQYEPCDGTEKDQDLAKLKLLSNSSKNENSDLSTVSFAGRILIRWKLWLPVIPKHLRADILRHFHDAPPRNTLVSRKLMTGFARDFTGRECTEMSFGMSCIIVGSAKGEKSVPQRPPGRLVPIPQL
ncbi:retrovirus-related Pol polyprotein from transposon opus [Trichonephila clavipes]|nr:retrovirus-related Pol polyprotein from transposon opus [Trichonephila clavipes]